jgi:hypothetical protein
MSAAYPAHASCHRHQLLAPAAAAGGQFRGSSVQGQIMSEFETYGKTAQQHTELVGGCWFQPCPADVLLVAAAKRRRTQHA